MICSNFSITPGNHGAQEWRLCWFTVKWRNEGREIR